MSQITVQDIKQLLADQPTLTTDSTLQQAIDLMQTGYPFVCAQCSGATTVPNADNTAIITCPLCGGIGKTEVEWEPVTERTGYRQVITEEV